MIVETAKSIPYLPLFVFAVSFVAALASSVKLLEFLHIGFAKRTIVSSITGVFCGMSAWLIVVFWHMMPITSTAIMALLLTALLQSRRNGQ